MPGLLLHCGGERVDWETVQAATTPAPTDTHYPIPHARILELAVEGLERQGLHVVESEHALAHDGDRYFGLLQLRNGAQDGDHLTSVDPVSADGIAGWDSGNTDNKGMLNTKATSKAGDYLVVLGSGLTGGLMISSGRGVWASEA